MSGLSVFERLKLLSPLRTGQPQPQHRERDRRKAEELRHVPSPLIAQYSRHVVYTPFVGMEKPKQLLKTTIGVMV